LRRASIVKQTRLLAPLSCDEPPTPMTRPSRTPLIAIVGRPNVGKSTLFNRFAGRRRALVDDVPGLTRDRIAQSIEVAGRRVVVVDTAGFEPAARGSLAAAVQEQARTAVRDADAILFVVDGLAGLLPEDEAIARELRKSRRPIALLVNKMDTPRHDPRAGEFHRLGFEPTRTISAEHGRGAWDALEEVVEALPPAPDEPEPDDAGAVRIAIVGRPNVGKSSLVNRLLGEQRMVVSEEGGTTRDAVDTRVEREDGVYVLVDTAGLRRRGRRDRLGEGPSAIAALRALERADVALVVTDASEGVTDLDVNVLGLAREAGCAAALVLNKWDLCAKRPPSERERLREAAAQRLRFAADVPQVAVSALSGSRVASLWALARRLAMAGRTRIATAALNRWLADATGAHEPAMAQRGTRKRPLKLLYATQTGVRPPSFVIFCSDPIGVKESYRRYLEKRLRERFDLAGTPIRISFRSRREKGGARKKSGGAR
jgi:GTP-binding protein